MDANLKPHTLTTQKLWAPLAWVSGAWQRDVLFEIGTDACWSAITADTSHSRAVQQGAHCFAGPVLPGLVNAHSHTFQRAFSGLTERREHPHDDFWGWRDRMYQVALSITPEQMYAIARQLYLELLRNGYTQICEFHYLQHSQSGAAYDDPLTMAWQLNEAARSLGFGITHLPVLYERSGFAANGLREDQRRFATTARWVTDAQQRLLREAGGPLCNAGVAIHSLRAAHETSIRELLQTVGDKAMPIHIHIAEQMGEVNDCLKTHGKRPIEWLCDNVALDARWQLVHATHAMGDEIDRVAASGAGVVICPTTEGNLGDGLTDVPRWLEQGTVLSIGSDSHATRDWREELRLLEYGQRLHLRARNVAAAPETGYASTAERLWQRVLDGGAAAAGFERWGFSVGARADLLHADPAAEATLGLPPDRLLDGLVFSSPSAPFNDVFVAGRWVLRNGVHAGQAAINAQFVETMQTLWSKSP